jgi:hypothetical protein
MSYTIFVSHSFSDLQIIEEMETAFEESSVKLYMANRDFNYGNELPAKIKRAIDNSDAVLAILTSNASESNSVNQEVGYAIGKEKLVVPMVEKGAKIGVLLEGLELVFFSLDKIREVFSDVSRYFSKLAASKEKKRTGKKIRDTIVLIGVALAAVALVGVLAYAATKKSHD